MKIKYLYQINEDKIYTIIAEEIITTQKSRVDNLIFLCLKSYHQKNQEEAKKIKIMTAQRKHIKITDTKLQENGLYMIYLY